jgi:transcriptional regulator with XRE-family HTH domain
MAEIGDLIKKKRLARELSLDRLAEELSIPRVYVEEIEANLELPGPELVVRICTVLGISVGELNALADHLSPAEQEWIEKHPRIRALFVYLRREFQEDASIQYARRFLNRRFREIPHGFLVTWESELRAIAAEASSWGIETGGDLFGRWDESPTILLATKAGPNAQRYWTVFRLDLQYLWQLTETLRVDWALRYFGDWHSHHRLGLSSPSDQDEQQVRSVARRR